MKTSNLFRLFISILMLCFTASISAQSKADQLFLEGQNLQKTMTVASQNAAIKKFQAAKVIYTTAEKKQMCDNQIDVCNRNTKTIKAQAAKKQEPKKEEEPKEEPKEEPAPKVEVNLVVTPAALEFASNPKGKAQTITVQCNVNWEITSHPDWVEIFLAEGKCSVVASNNDSGDKRSGVITIQAGDKQAIVVVNQKISLTKKVKKAFDL